MITKADEIELLLAAWYGSERDVLRADRKGTIPNIAAAKSRRDHARRALAERLAG